LFGEVFDLNDNRHRLRLRLKNSRQKTKGKRQKFKAFRVYRFGLSVYCVLRLSFRIEH
jgi:hypothetical protein